MLDLIQSTGIDPYILLYLFWATVGAALSFTGHVFVKRIFGDNGEPYEDWLYYGVYLDFIKNLESVFLGIVASVLNLFQPFFSNPLVVIQALLWTIIWPIQVPYSVYRMVRNERLLASKLIIKRYFQKYDVVMSRSEMVERLGVSPRYIDNAIRLCVIEGLIKEKVAGSMTAANGPVDLVYYERGYWLRIEETAEEAE